MENVLTVPAELLHRQLTTVFAAWGMNPDHADTAATIMVETDLSGVDSHGVGMLPYYQIAVREGRLDPRATPTITNDRGPAALIDGHHCIGHVAAHLAMTTAIDKAKEHGIGVTAVTNSTHYGAAGWYARMAADHGLIAISLTNSPPLLVPINGRDPALGTNPIAFAAHLAMTTAIDKAKEHGIGVTAVTNSTHYGAAGWYARMAAEHGLVAISLTNSPPLLVPTNGRDPALGTNPIAFAAPTSDTARPVLLDMATTAVAYGKVSIARRAGKSIPEGWALTSQGTPETDSAAAATARRLSPLGGTRKLGSHKGYGLALMVEILCATLTGARMASNETGHFFLAIDPAAFRTAEAFEEDLEELTARMRGIAPIDPAHPVLIPGDPEHDETVRRRESGIPMVPTLVEEVRGVCKETGAAFLL